MPTEDNGSNQVQQLRLNNEDTRVTELKHSTEECLNIKDCLKSKTEDSILKTTLKRFRTLFNTKHSVGGRSRSGESDKCSPELTRLQKPSSQKIRFRIRGGRRCVGKVT